MDELDLVRGLSRGVPAIDTGAEARAFARLDRHAAAPPRRRSGPAHRRPAPLLAAAILGCVVLAVGFLVPSALRRDASAAATLRELADVAAAQPLVLGPDSYAYTRSRESAIDTATIIDGTTFEFRVQTIREIWRATDGSGRIVEREQDVRPLTPDDEAAWREAGSPTLIAPEPADDRFGSGEFPAPDLSDAPPEPSELRELIASGGIVDVAPGDVGLFNAVGKLLSEHITPPAVRAGLFGVAAEIADVRDVGEIEDPLGRMGVGLKLSAGASSTTLIVDPETSMLLSVVQVRIDGQTVWTAYEPAAIVPDVEARP